MSSNKLFNRVLSIASHIQKSPIQQRATMATAATVSLGPSTNGVLNVHNTPPDSYNTASKLLQKNHDDFHIYFNTGGFHNHIAHHLLTILALGATPSDIQFAYDSNANYQRPQFPVDKDLVTSMSDPKVFKKYLANERYFHDFEIFFRKDIEARNGNWQAMLNEQLFGPSPQAQDLLGRMFAGFYHPVIHLGFGIEFSQPAIIVEALAQAAIHDNWPEKFLTQTFEKAKKRLDNKEKPRSLLSILEAARKDSTVRDSPHESDGNKVRDGVLKRALPQVVDLCSQWTVTPDAEDIRLKTAEMINFCAYFSGAAQHASRKKAIKFDFFYMHCINASIFYSAFLRPQVTDWLDKEAHAKMLMYKAWSDIAMYVSRGSPELFKDEITNYKPKVVGDWESIYKRVDSMEDDGHVSKLVRAMANGEQACKEYEGGEGKDWMIKGSDWLQLGHMAVDGAEGGDPKWVRNAGFESAWKGISERGKESNANESSATKVAQDYE